ncbi:MAG: peroxide stress protein YaaA [Flavobacteriia bacterium]|nr:peroxide stress protein YaaA [Flavobacteriia bacterium]
MDYRILISPAKNLKKQVFADHDRLSKPHFLKEAQTIHRSLAKYKTQQLGRIIRRGGISGLVRRYLT